MYFYGLIVAGFLVTGTVLLAMGINRAREWWESRSRQRRAPATAAGGRSESEDS